MNKGLNIYENYRQLLSPQSLQFQNFVQLEPITHRTEHGANPVKETPSVLKVLVPANLVRMEKWQTLRKLYVVRSQCNEQRPMSHDQRIKSVVQ